MQRCAASDRYRHQQRRTAPLRRRKDVTVPAESCGVVGSVIFLFRVWTVRPHSDIRLRGEKAGRAKWGGNHLRDRSFEGWQADPSRPVAVHTGRQQPAVGSESLADAAEYNLKPDLKMTRAHARVPACDIRLGHGPAGSRG